MWCSSRNMYKTFLAYLSCETFFYMSLFELFEAYENFFKKISILKNILFKKIFR